MTDSPLGTGDAERRRLIAQCEIHRPEAEQLMDRIGVGPGWQALDLGCGPLGVLDILAARVGAAGRVVGVDGAELVAADAAGTGLPTGSFDLVHERRALPPAAAALRRDPPGADPRLGTMTTSALDGCLRRLGAHLADPDTYTLYATLFHA